MIIVSNTEQDYSFQSILVHTKKTPGFPLSPDVGLYRYTKMDHLLAI